MYARQSICPERVTGRIAELNDEIKESMKELLDYRESREKQF